VPQRLLLDGLKITENINAAALALFPDKEPREYLI
jgi:hypothetical protein